MSSSYSNQHRYAVLFILLEVYVSMKLVFIFMSLVIQNFIIRRFCTDKTTKVIKSEPDSGVFFDRAGDDN